MLIRGSWRLLLSLCCGVWWWEGVVCTVIFVSNSTTVLRLCCVVLSLELWQFLYAFFLPYNKTPVHRGGGVRRGSAKIPSLSCVFKPSLGFPKGKRLFTDTVPLWLFQLFQLFQVTMIQNGKLMHSMSRQKIVTWLSNSWPLGASSCS